LGKNIYYHITLFFHYHTMDNFSWEVTLKETGDSLVFLRCLGRRLKEVAEKKDISISKWGESVGITDFDLNIILTGNLNNVDKTYTVIASTNKELLEKIASAIGVTWTVLEEMIQEAKWEEKRTYYWDDYDLIPPQPVWKQNEELKKIYGANYDRVASETPPHDRLITQYFFLKHGRDPNKEELTKIEEFIKTM